MNPAASCSRCSQDCAIPGGSGAAPCRASPRKEGFSPVPAHCSARLTRARGLAPGNPPRILTAPRCSTAHSTLAHCAWRLRTAATAYAAKPRCFRRHRPGRPALAVRSRHIAPRGSASPTARCALRCLRGHRPSRAALTRVRSRHLTPFDRTRGCRTGRRHPGSSAEPATPRAPLRRPSSTPHRPGRAEAPAIPARRHRSKHLASTARSGSAPAGCVTMMCAS